MNDKIPAVYFRKIYQEWVVNYGKTFPLYGNNTVRHDISGSIRPLLSSTEIPHHKVLTERSGISKKVIMKMLDDDDFCISFDIADKLLTAMDMTHHWFDDPLSEYYYG